MKRSFTNAALTLIMIIGACASASAQNQRTRDKLFPSFQQDLSAQQQKDAAPDPRKTATSTRSLIFTNYRPGANNAGNARRIISRPVAGGRQSLPSDVSAAEAARKVTPQAKTLKPTVPQQ